MFLMPMLFICLFSGTGGKIEVVIIKLHPLDCMFLVYCISASLVLVSSISSWPFHLLQSLNNILVFHQGVPLMFTLHVAWKMLLEKCRSGNTTEPGMIMYEREVYPIPRPGQRRSCDCPPDEDVALFEFSAWTSSADFTHRDATTHSTVFYHTPSYSS